MSNIDGQKEVSFYLYCTKCKHYKKSSNEQPCEDCLSEPVNLYSNKPVKFEKIK